MRIKYYFFLMNSIDLGLMFENDQQSPLCNLLLTHEIDVV